MMQLLAEGKTKQIWQVQRIGEKNVYVKSGDFITAGNGAKCDEIIGKGISCNTITCNMFKLLRENGILNHFYNQIDERTFLAQRLLMIDLEVVIRGIATGSYPGRAGIDPETIFSPPIVELFFKCDEFEDKKLCDPLIEYDEHRGGFVLYDPHAPRQSGFLGMLDNVLAHSGLKRDDYVLPASPEEFSFIKEMGFQSFICIKDAWRKVNVVIPDLKVEMGYVYGDTGEIKVGDVIDNDSWRARLYESGGIKWEEMSKQEYRDLKEVTPEALEIIRQKYEKMAELSAKLA